MAKKHPKKDASKTPTDVELSSSQLPKKKKKKSKKSKHRQSHSEDSGVSVSIEQQSKYDAELPLNSSESQSQEMKEKDLNLMPSKDKNVAEESTRQTKSIPIKLSVNVTSNLTANSSFASSFSSNTTNGSNQKPVSTGWSWGAAFAAASAIRPNDSDLDDKFLKAAAANEEKGENGGVVKISELAKQHGCTAKGDTDQCTKHSGTPAEETSARKKKKRKHPESDTSTDGICSGDDSKDAGSNRDGVADDGCDSINSDEMSLEGKMISFPSSNNRDSGESLNLVLIDRRTGNVYSSGERGHDGRRIIIGKQVKGKVEFDLSALKQIEQLEQGGPSSQLDTNGDTTSGPDFPYPTNPDDHCETPLQSYQDILPILDELSKSRGKKTMTIYDPYYCNGSVVQHLSSLGYKNVYNKKENCYEIWKQKEKYPTFDVFVTNPPYSEDHIEKLMKHVTSPSFGSKPWLLLMPNWVHKKDYYVNALSGMEEKPGPQKKRQRGDGHDVRSANQCNPFYVVPKKRYVYLPPPDFREKKESDVHKKSSPFVSMWYVWGGSAESNASLIEAFRRTTKDSGNCDLARSRSALRDLRRSGGSSSNDGKKKKSKHSKKKRF